MRLYAAATAKDTQLTLFSLGSKYGAVTGSPNLDEVFNLLNGSSATLNFNIEDDPNWRTPAYSELLFNGKVVSNERSYSGTVNSNLTVKHVNTLTGKESPIKTIQFVDPVGPENPTNLSWLNTQDPDGSGILEWSSHFSELTSTAISQNSELYGWSNYKQTVEYSRVGKDWTPVSAPYNLSEMFGDASQINLRVVYTVYDIIENPKDFIINLGTVNATDVRGNATYRISEITIKPDTVTVTDIETNSENSLSAAFNGSFKLTINILNGVVTVEANFTDEWTIQTNTGQVYTRSLAVPNEQGYYEFVNSDADATILVAIEETPVTWYTVQ